MAKAGMRETQGTRHAERDGKAEQDSTPPGTEGQENVRVSSAMDFDDESSGDDDGGGKVRRNSFTIARLRVVMLFLTENTCGLSDHCPPLICPTHKSSAYSQISNHICTA